ncbi:MAG: hypothetical protein HQL06_13690 [Nitrospirae bacterium]|nr:hypothetical protein [Nitrospirota bacterium]
METLSDVSKNTLNDSFGSQGLSAAKLSHQVAPSGSAVPSVEFNNDMAISPVNVMQGNISQLPLETLSEVVALEQNIGTQEEYRATNTIMDALDKELTNDQQIEAFRSENPVIYDMVKRMFNIILNRALCADAVGGLDWHLLFYRNGSLLQQPAEASTVLGNQNTSITQMATTTNSQAPSTVAEQAAAGIEMFLAPPRSTSGVNNTQEVFSNQQIEQFYRSLAAGRYRGKEKEARDIELRIARAINEGRISN